ncbi:MAG: site-specific DNA-methyltransferase [Candidatus Thorarchaeota archaeon]|nr:site-specific DNA-methyltransferase [Candidatus Thorarchaeota archaeon]
MRQRPKNTMNDLDSKEWVKSTKSWFIINPRPRSDVQLEHPAKFPEELVKHFLRFFTKEGSWVLDPFAGIGSTLIACKESSRNSVGIELNPEFVDIGRRFLSTYPGKGEHHFLDGNSMRIRELLENEFKHEVPTFDFLITSPPYWDMLRKSRGGNDSIQKDRKERGLRQFYSNLEYDLGNIDNYYRYIETLSSIICSLKPFLRDGAYLSIIVQNMRDTNGEMRPIAWDVAKQLSNQYQLQQEMIWCQDNKKLGCWGYPTTYVSNVHHHYCLIFRNSV